MPTSTALGIGQHDARVAVLVGAARGAHLHRPGAVGMAVLADGEVVHLSNTLERSNESQPPPRSSYPPNSPPRQLKLPACGVRQDIQPISTHLPAFILVVIQSSVPAPSPLTPPHDGYLGPVQLGAVFQAPQQSCRAPTLAARGLGNSACMRSPPVFSTKCFPTQLGGGCEPLLAVVLRSFW